MNTSQNVYLKQNVQVEPLFNQWYAWTYLVSPATAAMYISNLHVKIMQSFISAPDVHVAACKNPAMLGGPFIRYGPDRVGEIKALLEKTVREQSHMLEFAKAVKSLEEMLTSEASGFSLEPLYRKIPDVLRGYVELVYDLNNNCSIRFVEGLLYKSPYYNRSSQSLALSLIERDDRPFVLSTPRVEDERILMLKLPFEHEALDELFKMKQEPRPFGHIKESLSVSDRDEELFASFFTDRDEATVNPRYDGDKIRIRYFGHGCILIEWKGCSVLTDPLISYKYDNGIQRYTFADLPEIIDYVLLTHNHQDHVMFEVLLQLRHKIRNVIVPKNSGGPADPSLKLILRQIGMRNVTEIEELETIDVGPGFVTGLPFFGEHADLNIRTKIAYLIRMGSRSIMCVADSNNLEPKLYDHLHDAFGDLDMLFIGMECQGAPLSWLYGPLMTKPLARKQDQSRRFDGSDYQKGIGIVDRFKFKHVYVYAMGMEPWLTHITSIDYTKDSHQIIESDKLVADCKGRGITAERLFGQKEILLDPQ